MSKKLVLGFSKDALLPPEIELVRSILRTSSLTEGKWEVGKNGGCDAILVKDNTSNTSPFKPSKNTPHIFVRRRGESSDGFVFFKPFRADELVKLLVQIQSGVTAKKSSDVKWIDLLPSASFKLKKWPTSEILSKNKHYTRLATYLIRNYKSVNDLVLLSGATADECNSFLTALDENKLLLVSSNKKEENVPTFGKQVTQVRRPSKIQGSFISGLRKRFGLTGRA